ncbi:hypothetical protein ACFSKN_18330 [Mariniflexile gromovii]|uniref:Uncharacterized protein n=1 Tax=Mariniflexile gromovii TaxID=362523 RepID=A0ABS4BWH3_9FLAO|nr:hypothetical protein [Mariniflexile gromovii]MBP0904943.1 hypothetical protein [Mariniflexile gromovii]
MEINGKRIEKLGFKAFKKGFYNEWKSLTDAFKKENDISLNEASEKAFNELSTKSS